MTHIDDDSRCPHCQQMLDAEQEIERLRSDNGNLQVALVSACTPPWPSWVTPDVTGVQSLAAFHLRKAIDAVQRAAGGGDE